MLMIIVNRKTLSRAIKATDAFRLHSYVYQTLESRSHKSTFSLFRGRFFSEKNVDNTTHEISLLESLFQERHLYKVHLITLERTDKTRNALSRSDIMSFTAREGVRATSGYGKQSVGKCMS